MCRDWLCSALYGDLVFVGGLLVKRPNLTGALTAQRFSLPGNQVKREVNKLYKLLEIDIDGIYKTVCMGGGGGGGHFL
jgi:hypothetical protein